MPNSSTLGKKETGEWFNEHQLSIKRILDIGAGSGTYAKLVKHRYNCCNNAEWIAIEAWEEYIEQFKLPELYNQIINQDARNLDWDNLGKFDVTIAGDVLEHMTKKEAVTLVNTILDNSKMLIVSLPICYYPQDAYQGNPFEIHVKPDWSHTEVIDTWGVFIKKSFVGKYSLEKNKPPLEIGVYWLSRD